MLYKPYMNRMVYKKINTDVTVLNFRERNLNNVCVYNLNQQLF